MTGFLALAAFAATVPLANWMIGNVGACVPGGPCLIPVGFGLHAPSGVLVVGVALVLRDLVHCMLGWRWAAMAVLAGTVLSAVFAPPALVLASGAAFLLSELADLMVFEPLVRRGRALAVAASGLVGVVVDSALFLWLAFGSLAHIEGQIVGKLWATAIAAIVLSSLSRRKDSAA